MPGLLVPALFLMSVLSACALDEAATSDPASGAALTFAATTAVPPTTATVPPTTTTTTTVPPTTTTVPPTTTTVPPTTTTTTTVPPTTTTTFDPGAWPLGFDDPRGEVFSDFQAAFDRGDPFQRLEVFCLPDEAPTSALRATDEGITEEAIRIVHLRTRLEDYERIGFEFPVGDTTEMVEAFVGIVNDECGGVYGRRLDLRTVEVTSLGGGGTDIDTLRSAACLEATEELGAVLVLDLTGLQGSAPLCIADTGRTPLITTEPQSSDDLRAAYGRLLTTAVASDTQLELAARSAEAGGLLAGETIAVVVSDTPGQSEAVSDGLLETMDGLGYDAKVHLIGCEGTTSCSVGLAVAVERMVDDGTTVVFPVLNAVSLPGLLMEMIRQGMPTPAFVQTGLNGQSGDLAAAQVLAFGGSEAAAYYDGAFIVDASGTGTWRLPDTDRAGFPDPFSQMCNAEYGRVTGLPVADPTTIAYSSVADACSIVRIAARTLRDAGANPRQADVNWVLYRLDEVDIPDMLPTSSARRKNDLPDVVRNLEYQYPCRLGIDTDAAGDSPRGCIVPNGEWQAFR